VAWTDVLAEHFEVTRRLIGIHDGTEIKTTGDGILAMFQGPAAAIQFGLDAARAVDEIGLTLRVGIHTGECTIIDDDVAGVAVHIAARIGAIAGRGQVAVSQTVKDLVAGSGIPFDSLGQHRLKGINGQWTVFQAKGA